MYFLILRPQQKRVKDASGNGQERRRGDTIVTNGGLIGKVTKVIDDDQIEIEIADGVKIRQMRQMVTDVRAKGEPVKDAAAAARLRFSFPIKSRRHVCISRGGRRRRSC
jgi:preprotein translocase subunit YajC